MIFGLKVVYGTYLEILKVFHSSFCVLQIFLEQSVVYTANARHFWLPVYQWIVRFFFLFQSWFWKFEKFYHLMGPLVSRKNLIDVIQCAREYKIIIIKGNVIVFLEIDNVFVVDFLYFFVSVNDLDG